MNRARVSFARRSGGFTLVEVVIAATVLALGLLGGGATMLAALQASHEAQLRTRAEALASDLLERIRSNVAAAGDYTLRDGEDAPVPGAPCSVATPCIPADWAEYDLHEWQQAVRASLPAARAEVSVETLEGGAVRCTVSLRWSMPGRDGPDSLTLSTDA